jgi:hypothetical protein
MRETYCCHDASRSGRKWIMSCSIADQNGFSEFIAAKVDCMCRRSTQCYSGHTSKQTPSPLGVYDVLGGVKRSPIRL